jgi:2-polyprenyl-6-methoxyphenol hydroxylase-like FAD-dependent oxidoreductase
VSQIDVLIVGAGPAGSTLASDLVRRGVEVRLIDTADGAFAGSRAKGIQPRTQEVFDDLGVLDQALAAGGPYPPMAAHVGRLTVSWRMQRSHRPSPAVPYPNVLLLPQRETDGILHDRLCQQGLQIEFGTTLTGLHQNADEVVATVQTGRGAETIRTRYLVGADGGASATRKQLNSSFVGSTDDSDRMIVADAEIEGLPRNRWHVWPRAKGRFLAICPLPNSSQFQIMLRLRPDEQPDVSEHGLAESVRTLTGDPALRLHRLTWASVFRPNIRMVERYRSGRVLLAGDAAHVHTPAGAQGLNTGVQDSYNLGWKLGQVLSGAPDALLDTYETERLPVAARVLGVSTQLYAGLEKRRLSSLRRSDEERQLSLSYHGTPLAPSTSARTEKLRVGDRAPDGTQQGERLFDAFRGPHFMLLAFDREPSVAWPTAGAPLHTITITSAAQQLRRDYGITRPTHILIRPDGYIAHITDRGPGGIDRQTLTRLAPASPIPFSRSRPTRS